MREEKWMIRAKKADFFAIADKHSVSPVVARLLVNRGVSGDEEIDLYLNGSVKDLNSPWLLKDMDRAVDILSLKINQKNRIRIICDYDIDGICSGYILKDALTTLGAMADVAVPKRMDDGYGINTRMIDQAVNDGIDTIVTCDNGIAAAEEAAYASKSGITMIVTDHHEVPFEEKEGKISYIIPPADAVIDPKQNDCAYPFKDLCGTSVAYKLIQALFETNGLTAEDAEKYLEYAAIATIGDVVQLRGENRVIARLGIERLKKTENAGLNALIDACGIDKETISSDQIGFVLGPCLNASGRMGDAKTAVSLLGCENADEAKKIAGELKSLNDERKSLTEKGFVKACELMKGQKNERVPVLFLKDGNESVAGIIAGRIREKFNKPVFVFTPAKEGVKGSGRSIECYNMYGECSRFKSLFTRFGGHRMAAGISMPEENLSAFREGINESCTLTDEDLIPEVWIDMILPVGYLSMDFVGQLSIMEPFGKGNEKPLFADRGLKVARLRLLGADGGTLKLSLRAKTGHTVEGICFRSAAEIIRMMNARFGEDEVKKASRGLENKITLDVAYYPQINYYRGTEELQIVIEKIRC